MTGPLSSEFTPRSLTVAGSAMAATMFSSMVFAMIAVAIFMDQISSDYHWGHGQIGAAVTILSVGTAISSRIFGPLVDMFGPRAVTLPLTFISGLTLASFSLLWSSLPAFYAAHFLLGLGSPGAVAHSKLIATWFFRRRGIALTVMALGAAFAQMILPPLTRAVMNAIGWHQTYLVFGLAGLLICFPILLAFYRERRSGGEDAGDKNRNSGEVAPDGAPRIGIRDAMAGRTYWLIIGMQIAGIFAYTGLGTHALGILGEHGVSPDYRVWGLSLLAFGALAAQIGIGFLLDLFDTPRVVIPFALAALGGLILMAAGRGNETVLAGILLFGLGTGGETGMTSYFISRYFGVRNFSTIYGSLFLLLLIGSSGSVIVGLIFDRTGSYGPALVVVAGALLLAILLLSRLGPYPYPVKRGDEGMAALNEEPLARTNPSPQAG